MQKKITLFCLLALLVVSSTTLASDEKWVVAHRGASGYLPENTLEAYALAYGMGPDFIETDVQLTKDGVPIVLHDLQLENTTNVREVFPNRARADGKWYAIDFTLAEIKQLQANERTQAGRSTAQYPKRFPVGASDFAVPTFAEFVELITGLNKSTGRNVIMLVELKSPSFHVQNGYDLEKAVLDVLAQHDLTSADSPVVLQSFESEGLKRLRFELETELPIYQLISASSSYNSMVTEKGLDEIATYAQGIGPSVQRVANNNTGRPVNRGSLIAGAHKRGLKVMTYTLRQDQLPRYAKTLEEQVEHLLYEIGVDGVITDHPDVAVEVVRSRTSK